MSWQGMMRDLEEKEKELNKLKMKSDGLLNNNHPASDKIQVRRFFVFFSGCHKHKISDWFCINNSVLVQAYMDTLQTQWSWLLQITKCIHVHLKENAAYSQVSSPSCSLLSWKEIPESFPWTLIQRWLLLPCSVFQGGQWDLYEAAEGAWDYPKQVHLWQEHPTGKPDWTPERPGGIIYHVCAK